MNGDEPNGNDHEMNGNGKPPPAPPTVQMFAVFGLVITMMCTVIGVTYSAVIKGVETAQSLLGTLATASLSACVVLASGRHRDEK